MSGCPVHCDPVPLKSLSWIPSTILCQCKHHLSDFCHRRIDGLSSQVRPASLFFALGRENIIFCAFQNEGLFLHWFHIESFRVEGAVAFQNRQAFPFQALFLHSFQSQYSVAGQPGYQALLPQLSVSTQVAIFHTLLVKYMRSIVFIASNQLHICSTK